MEQITSIVEQITHWGLTGIWKILFAIIIWFVGKKVIALCMKFLKKVFDKGSLDPGVVNFTMSIIRFALYSVLILMVIDELGIQTTSLVTVFGSAALAIGMSLQGSLSNFAGGVLILIFKPFKVGDYIVVGNLEGTVRTIELLYTKLTTVDNKVVMLPNGALSNSNIVNVGAEDNRRLDIEMSIGYSSDLKLAKNILSDILAADNSILKDKEVKVIVKSLDESCVTLETRAWVKTEDYWDTRFELLEEYKSEFDKNGIENTLYELLLGEAETKDTIVKDVVENLDLIPSNINLSGAEIELVGIDDKEFILKGITDKLRRKYDYIILDCPPSLNMLTINALTAATSVLVPIQCEYYALEGLSQLIHTIDLVKERLNKRLKMEGVVFTMYDARTNLSLQVVENVKENLNQNIYKTIIPRNVRLAEAPSYGQPINIYDPRSAGAESYRLLAEEVLNREDN